MTERVTTMTRGLGMGVVQCWNQGTKGQCRAIQSRYRWKLELKPSMLPCTRALR